MVFALDMTVAAHSTFHSILQILTINLTCHILQALRYLIHKSVNTNLYDSLGSIQAFHGSIHERASVIIHLYLEKRQTKYVIADIGARNRQQNMVHVSE